MLIVGDRAIVALLWRYCGVGVALGRFFNPSHAEFNAHADFTEFGGQYETGTYTGGRCHIG